MGSATVRVTDAAGHTRDADVTVQSAAGASRWAAPIASSADVLDLSKILSYPPTTPAYDPATGLFTGKVNRLAEGRMVALSPSRVAMLTEQRNESPLADNVATFHFQFLSDAGAGTFTDVTSPTQTPSLATEFANAGGGDPGGWSLMTATNRLPHLGFYLNGFNPPGSEASHFDTVAHLAARLTATDRTFAIAMSRPDDGVQLGWFSPHYVPDPGEILMFTVVAAHPDGSYDYSLTSNLRTITGSDVEWANGWWMHGDVQPGDWARVTFGPAARTYVANADGTLTVTVNPAVKALADLSAAVFDPGTTFWNGYGLSLQAVDVTADPALPPRPAGTEANWNEGLVTVYDVASNDQLVKAGQVFLHENDVENMQDVSMGNGGFLLYATHSSGSDLHFGEDHPHVGLVSIASDGTPTVVSHLALTGLADLARQDYYSITVQKVSETDAVVFWLAQLNTVGADGDPLTRFVLSHVRIVNGALVALDEHTYASARLTDAELLAKIATYVPPRDAAAAMFAFEGDSDTPIAKQGGGTMPSLVRFFQDGWDLSEAGGGYNTSDSYFDTAGQAFARNFYGQIDPRSQPDEVSESSAQLPDGRAVFVGWADSYGQSFEVDEYDTTYTNGQPTQTLTRSFTYNLSAQSNYVFVAKLLGNGSLQITKSDGWSELGFRYSVTHSTNDGVVQTSEEHAFVDFAQGAEVGLYEGGLAASERGVLIHDDQLASPWDASVGLTPVTIDEAGVATAQPTALVLAPPVIPADSQVKASGGTPLVYVGSDQFATVLFHKGPALPDGSDAPSVLTLFTFGWDGASPPQSKNVVPLLASAGVPYAAHWPGYVQQAALPDHRLVFAAEYNALMSGETSVSGGADSSDSVVVGVLAP